MMKNRIALTIVNLLILCLSLCAQSNNWTYPEVEILLSPSPAYLCPNEDLIIECEQDFLSFRWLDENGIEIGNEKSISINREGDYKLVVENQTNTTLCEYEYEFQVLDYDDFSDLTYQKLTLYDIFVPSDFETLNGEEIATPRDPVNCNTECDNVTYSNDNTEICYLEYTELVYHPDFCAEDPNPLYPLLYNIIESSSSSPSKGFLITTTLSDLENCCDLRANIQENYMDNIDEYQVGVWIVTKPSMDFNGTVVHQSTVYYRNELNNNEEISFDFGLEPMVSPNPNNLIHASQLSYIGEPIKPHSNSENAGDYEGNGINDYANLSNKHRQLIEDKVESIKNDWDIDVEFNFSAYCASTLLDGNIIPSEVIAKDNYDSSDADLVYWIHFNPDGTAIFDAKSQNSNINSKFSEDPDYYDGFEQDVNDAIAERLIEAGGLSKSVFNHLSINIGTGDPQIDALGMSFFGVRTEFLNDDLGFFDYSMGSASLMIDLIRKGVMPEKAWRQDGQDGVKSIYKLPPAAGGLGDGVLEINPVSSAIQCVDLVYMTCTDKQTQDGIWEMIKHPIETGKHVFIEEWDNLNGSNGKENQHHGVTKSGVKIAATILTGGGIITTLKNATNDATGAIESVRDVLKNFDGASAKEMLRRCEELIPDASETQEFLEMLKKAGQDKWEFFTNNPDMINVWRKVKDDFPTNLSEFGDIIKTKFPVENFAEFKEVFLDGIHPNLTVKLNVKVFLDDLAVVADDFVTTMKLSGNIKAWREILARGLPVSWRRNPKYIRPFAKALDEKPAIDLHLNGHINSNGNAVGCHLTSAIDDVNVRLRTPQPDGFPKYYENGSLKEAAIDIKNGDDWTPKVSKSTFFPDGWSNDKALNELAYIRSNPANMLGDRKWRGLASDGETIVEVQYTGPLDDLTFNSVFPK